jgi:hypothetical protein
MILGHGGMTTYLDSGRLAHDRCLTIVAWEADGEAREGISSATEKAQAMIEQRFPPGWDEQRVERLLADLDSRT